MNIKCLWGSHIWDGCICTICSKVRNEQHNWDSCKCSRCNTKRDEQHEWDGCKCLKCEKIRNEKHHWVDFQCSRCGKFATEDERELISICKLTDKDLILEIALTTKSEEVMKSACAKLNQSILIEIVLNTEQSYYAWHEIEKNYSARDSLQKTDPVGLKEIQRFSRIYWVAWTFLNENLRKKFVDVLYLNHKSLRDSELRSMASKYDLKTVPKHVRQVKARERNVTFTFPCNLCGYKTNLTVTIDWVGNILHGKNHYHEFECQNCNRTFTVNEDSLKPYTNQFV